MAAAHQQQNNDDGGGMFGSGRRRRRRQEQQQGSSSRSSSSPSRILSVSSSGELRIDLVKVMFLIALFVPTVILIQLSLSLDLSGYYNNHNKNNNNNNFHCPQCTSSCGGSGGGGATNSSSTSTSTLTSSTYTEATGVQQQQQQQQTRSSSSSISISHGNENSENTSNTIIDYPEVDSQRLNLVIISNRKENPNLPLKALINSLLKHTTESIVLNIVSDYSIPFLDEIQGSSRSTSSSSSSSTSSSPFFKVYYHSAKELYNHVIQFMNDTKFQTKHYSATYAMSKLFLSTITTTTTNNIGTISTILQYPKNTSKILVIDDDMIFYKDLSILYHDHIMVNPNKLSLYCPIDAWGVKYFSHGHLAKRPNNGDTERYCNTGLIGFPTTISTTTTTTTTSQSQSQQLLSSSSSTSSSSSVMDIITNAANNMEKQYPNTSYWVADQDIMNRVYVENKNKNIIDLIPCEWNCDYETCRSGTKYFRHRCRNCSPPYSQCSAFHFTLKSYTMKLPFETKEERWDYYYEMDTMKLLKEEFEPRIKLKYNITSSSAATPPATTTTTSTTTTT